MHVHGNSIHRVSPTRHRFSGGRKLQEERKSPWPSRPSGREISSWLLGAMHGRARKINILVDRAHRTDRGLPACMHVHGPFLVEHQPLNYTLVAWMRGLWGGHVVARQAYVAWRGSMEVEDGTNTNLARTDIVLIHRRSTPVLRTYAAARC